MENFVPLPYNRISVREVEFPLNETTIRSALLGKEAYFETDYVVFRRGAECAVAGLLKDRPAGLFALIRAVEIVALPDSCRWIEDFTVDTGNPSALAEKAHASGTGAADTLVVNGRYEHVNFIHRPRSKVLHVFDVSPPTPPRLVDLTQQVIAYQNFPATRLAPHVKSILELTRHVRNKPLLFPCGVSEFKTRSNAFYLDQRPARQDWVLAGCERSAAIHRRLYGEDCPRIELCPRKLFSVDSGLAIMRCCMVEQRVELSDRVAVVPWGTDRSLIEQGCRALLAVE